MQYSRFFDKLHTLLYKLLLKKIENTNILARVAPEEKLIIVNLLKKHVLQQNKNKPIKLHSPSTIKEIYFSKHITYGYKNDGSYYISSDKYGFILLQYINIMKKKEEVNYEFVNGNLSSLDKLLSEMI